jgi:SAM-dependent methyltransferase/lipopolysaccharide biosynthesis regulator YciM
VPKKLKPVGLEAIFEGAFMKFAKFLSIPAHWSKALKQSLKVGADRCATDAQLHVERAKDLRRQGDSKAAEAVVRQGLSLYPDDLKLRRESAEIAMMSANWPDAVERWQAALALSSKAPSARVYAQLSRAYRQKANINSAEAAVSAGLALFPRDIPLRREFAELAMAKGDWTEAVRRWETVLDMGGGRRSANIYLRMSVALRSQQDAATEEAIVHQGLTVHPRDLKLARRYAELATSEQDWPKAIERWRSVLKLAGTSSLASDYVQLSNVLRCHGDVTAADAVSKQAVTTIASCYDNMVGAYQERHRTFQTRDRWLNQLADGLCQGASVLDLGCGAGVPIARELALRGCKVLGLDASPQQIAAARSNVPTAEFREADMMKTEFQEATFDAVAAFYSIIHVPRAEHAILFARIASWLRRDGVFVASLGAGDFPDRTKKWFGTQMYFSHFDAETNIELIKGAGLVIDRTEVAEEEDRGGKVLWVQARKQAASQLAVE